VADLISVIVPVYNEAATISAVIERLLSVPLPAPREIIVVNDGSRDLTRDVLDGLQGTSRVLTIVHADRNSGKGAAVRLGLARSKGTITAIQDADLELNPAQIGSLVEPILQGAADVVYGSRFLDDSGSAVPLMTRVANRLLTAATNLLYGSSLTDMETCYKVMRGDIARGLHLEANRFDIEPEITARLLRAGYRIVERPVVFTPRSRSAGKKIRWRDGVQALVRLVRCRFGASVGRPNDS
jgi:glycosyltransferase involved in cell wall biosynthesis